MIVAHKNSILLGKRIKDGYRNFSMHRDFYTFNKRKEVNASTLAREMDYRAQHFEENSTKPPTHFLRN